MLALMVKFIVMMVSHSGDLGMMHRKAFSPQKSFKIHFISVALKAFLTLGILNGFLHFLPQT